jgi:hypothetical protein
VRRNRVPCENFYGRLKTLWRITAIRFRWDHSYYDKIMKLCVALTSFHVQLNPLRAADGDMFRSIMEKFISEGKERKRKRDNWHENYIERRKRRRVEQKSQSSSSSSSSSSIPGGD